MTQVVTVQTDFEDLSQMTQGLMERVHETHVILTGPDDINEGEWVQFAVNLNDGTPGFAGVGRCVRSVDNGDARLPHQRFDLVLDSLQFDQHGQDVYQYILMSRQAAEGEDAGFAAEHPDSADDEATMVASGPEMYESAAEDVAEDVGDDSSLQEVASDEMSEAQLQSTDEGAAAADYDSVPGMEDAEFGAAPEPPPPAHTGPRKFVFADGLPLPTQPPRPDLDPGLRVTPAPRPASSKHPGPVDDGVDPFEEARAQQLSSASDDEYHSDDDYHEETAPYDNGASQEHETASNASGEATLQSVVPAEDAIAEPEPMVTPEDESALS